MRSGTTEIDVKKNHIAAEADAMDRRFAFLSCVVLLAAGCKQSPYVSSHLEILGAERRALEDRVLDLEFELAKKEKLLQSQGSAGGSGSSERGPRPAASGRGSDRSSRSPDPADDSDLGSPSIVIPGLDGDLSSPLEPPRVDEGQPADSVLPSPLGDSAMRSPRYQTPTRPASSRSRVPGDPRITHIKINPTLTGGTDFDRKSGDDGLVIVLEPRNADEEFVPLAGPITAVLLDYAKREEGAGAMVARWEIDAQNVHQAIVDDEYAKGIQLRLPWPDQLPEHSKLRLDVRYTTVDGRHLDARTDVHVTLPGQFSSRWTPRAPSTDGDDRETPGSQPPVNIAQQPGEKESARTNRTHNVVQSSFTTIADQPVGTGVATQAQPPEAARESAATAIEKRWTPKRQANTVPDSDQSASGQNESPRRPAWQPNR